MRTWSILGALVAVSGIVLMLVPRYLARPAQEPVFVGTYVGIGVPLLVLGAALVAWDLWRARAKTGA